MNRDRNKSKQRNSPSPPLSDASQVVCFERFVWPQNGAADLNPLRLPEKGMQSGVGAECQETTSFITLFAASGGWQRDKGCNIVVVEDHVDKCDNESSNGFNLLFFAHESARFRWLLAPIKDASFLACYTTTTTTTSAGRPACLCVIESSIIRGDANNRME